MLSYAPCVDRPARVAGRFLLVEVQARVEVSLFRLAERGAKTAQSTLIFLFRALSGNTEERFP